MQLSLPPQVSTSKEGLRRLGQWAWSRESGQISWGVWGGAGESGLQLWQGSHGFELRGTQRPSFSGWRRPRLGGRGQVACLQLGDTTDTDTTTTTVPARMAGLHPVLFLYIPIHLKYSPNILHACNYYLPSPAELSCFVHSCTLPSPILPSQQKSGIQ